MNAMVKKGSVVVYVVQQLQQHATSSLLMINGYIHVMSCNRMCTDYYKLGPEILGWCKTCISNREGMSIESMMYVIYMGTCVRRKHVQYQIDAYSLSKVFVMCVSSVLVLGMFPMLDA